MSSEASIAAGECRLAISPNTGRVGTWGTWVATFTVGSTGIAKGGGIRVALPNRWHQWHRNSARRLQTWDPTEAFYVTARTDRDDVRLSCKIPGATADEYSKAGDKLALGGVHERSRYGWTVCVTLDEGSLVEGDTIEVVYGDKSQGGRGFTPPLFAGSPELVHAAVDPTGEGEYVLLADENLPVLYHTPGPAVELLIVLPSIIVVGEQAVLRMVALDQNQNGVPSPDTVVRLALEEGEAELPVTSVNLGGPETLGSCTTTFWPTTAGVLRIKGTSADGALYSRSNASVVVEAPPVERLYWGDLHSHSHYSFDGSGTGDDHFRYARYAALLDVYSASDHSDRRSLRPELWRQNIEYTERWHQAGTFATLFGFEASYDWPVGHHNVYYPHAEGAFWQIEQLELEEAWRQGTPGDMLTIPHHTGATMGAPPGETRIDWTIHDERFRTTAEIYSSHGHSEEWAPNHPLSFDVVDFTWQGPQDPGSYLQDAWLMGLKLGVIASSDNHASQPGKEGFGAVGVWAPELTREAVFEAIRKRRTYGSTGSRIYLELFANGEPMGSEIELARKEPVEVRVSVLGTGPLRWTEILRADLDRPDEGFSVVRREWYPGASAVRGATVEWTDEAPPDSGIYYVRTRQQDLVHGRVAEAWSSPVWTRVVSAQAR